jgi:hypothetical protein
VSGGSLDYTCWEMENGGCEKFARYADDIISELSEVLDRLRQGPHTTCSNMEDVALNSAINKVRRAKLFVTEVQEMMLRLAPVAKAAEWKRSGDWGDNNVRHTIAAEVFKSLGVEYPPKESP